MFLLWPILKSLCLRFFLTAYNHNPKPISTDTSLYSLYTESGYEAHFPHKLTNYYFWIKEEGVNPAGTGGQKLYINSSENDGGSGNSFGRIYHKINTLTGDLITISAGDKMQIGISNQLKISGFDSALVSIAETNIPIDIPEVKFPASKTRGNNHL